MPVIDSTTIANTPEYQVNVDFTIFFNEHGTASAIMIFRCRQALARSCRLLLKASQVLLGTPSVRYGTRSLCGWPGTEGRRSFFKHLILRRFLPFNQIKVEFTHLGC